VNKSLTYRTLRLSFRDPAADKYIGSDEAWNKAESAIRRAVETLGMEYFEGGKWFGPARFHCPDALDREWQLGTVQVDYNLPERFDLGTWQRMALANAVMIHCSFGSWNG